MHPFTGSAGDLESHHHVGDRKRVVKEDPGEVAVLRVPSNAAPPQVTLGLERCRTPVPEGIDEGLGAADVPVELHRGSVEIAVVEEELEAPEGRLRAASGERDEVGRPEEPVAVDGAEDAEIAGREDYAARRGALEARPASLGVRHLSERSGREAFRKGGSIGRLASG